MKKANCYGWTYLNYRKAFQKLFFCYNKHSCLVKGYIKVCAFIFKETEQLFAVSYYKQLSAVIKRKNYKIKTSFVIPGLPKANKTCIYCMICLFNIRGNCL